MAKHRVVVHTRTLRLTLHAEFDTAATLTTNDAEREVMHHKAARARREKTP